jgi:hypothetical protein
MNLKEWPWSMIIGHQSKRLKKIKIFIMKCLSFFIILACSAFTTLQAQNKLTYPDPEFGKEVYGYKKNNNELVRLEKETSTMKSKTKMGGFAGAQTAYEIEGKKSSARFQGTENLTFIFQSGYGKKETNADKSTQAKMGDSMNMMSVNTMTMPDMSSIMDMINDPAKTISLYEVSAKDGKRKIVIQESGGMTMFSKKEKSNTKYSLSFKKVKEGYFEIVVDKKLPRGEYVFLNAGQGNSMDNSSTLFAFAID